MDTNVDGTPLAARFSSARRLTSTRSRPRKGLLAPADTPSNWR